MLLTLLVPVVSVPLPMHEQSECWQLEAGQGCNAKPHLPVRLRVGELGDANRLLTKAAEEQKGEGAQDVEPCLRWEGR